MRGYNQEEVDQYLDIIIKDYEIFTKYIEELQLEGKKRMSVEEFLKGFRWR